MGFDGPPEHGTPLKFQLSLIIKSIEKRILLKSVWARTFSLIGMLVSPHRPSSLDFSFEQDRSVHG